MLPMLVLTLQLILQIPPLLVAAPVTSRKSLRRGALWGAHFADCFRKSASSKLSPYQVSPSVFSPL